MALNNKATLPPFPEVNPELLQEWNHEKNDGLDPYSLSAGCDKKVWWKCKVCKHEWDAIVSNRARKGRGCPKCARVYVGKDDSIAVLFPSLMKEWHPTLNNHLDPTKISRGSAKRASWICAEGHVWESSIINRTKNDAGCTICSGYSPSEKNSLASLYPDVAVEWHPTKNVDLSPANVTCKSGKRVWWKCKTCLYEWQTNVKNRTLLGSPCPLCSKDKAVIENKKTQLAKKEIESTYTYDVEDRLFLKYQEIQDIFKSHLKIEPESKSIESLFSPRNLNKIQYDPYYQRNYVWDKDKATYFMESILIGTEIPPLIFYESNQRLEVIDGRQRFETIKRFYEDDLQLTKKGLSKLKPLLKKTFSTLDDDLKDIFFDTKIRIIKFTVIDETRIDAKKQDMLKKEIFRRYNSGITPLRRVEIEKAIYIDDSPTNYFKKQLKRNKYVYEAIVSLFLAERDLELLDKPITLEKSLQEIRFLLIAPEMPIVSTRRKDTFNLFYDRFSDGTDDVQKLYKDFLEKIHIATAINEKISSAGLKSTRYFNETLFWGISILIKENFNIDILKSDDFGDDVVNFLTAHSSIFDPTERQFFYAEFVTRYDEFAQFIENKFDTNLRIYMSSSPSFKEKLKEYEQIEAEEQNLNYYDMRIDKTEAIPYSIDDICRLMLRGKFIVRPVYQRGEVINKAKSSAIMESILLGIKLPPLYIFKKEDGVLEIIDGQQRLLSILGFIGQSFIDASGKKIISEKNEFSLTKLKILTDLNGLQHKDLNESLQDKIYDFSLSLIIIDQKLNPNFDPIDLFIRLNNRPYPIKENTFEMWNSYIDKEIIDSIKTLTQKYRRWFYLRKNNLRMHDEELFTIILYLEHNSSFLNHQKESFYPYLDFFQRETVVHIRIKQKSDVTKLLNNATLEDKEKENLLKSIKSTDSFLRKLKSILIDHDVENEDQFLEKELTALFNVNNKKYYGRKLQDYYALWFAIHFLNFEMIARDRSEIKRRLKEIFNFMRSDSIPGKETRTLDDFLEIINKFKKDYTVDQRKIRLTSEEKKELIKLQENICPLCNGSLFINDEIEVDHSKPLSRGGRDRFLNLQITHKHCNRKKGARG